MQISDRVPGFKWLVAFWTLTAVVWTVLEGDLQRVQFFGFLTTLTGLAYLFQRIMAGRKLPRRRALAIMGLWGIALGVGSVLMTLFLMAVKTGLHAHGPEFTAADIDYVWRRLSMWGVAGLLAGLGLGLVLAALKPGQSIA